MKSLKSIFMSLFLLVAETLFVGRAYADAVTDINMLFIGNSITAGATIKSSSTQAPPVICSNVVREATGIKVNLYNGGHSGITTVGFLPGGNDFTKIINKVKEYQNNKGPIYFSIMLGTNDSSYGSANGGGHLSNEEYKSNLKKIIDKLIETAPTCKILLNYPIWYSPNTHNGARYLQESLDRLRNFYPVIDAIVAEYDQVYAGDRTVWEYFENNKTLFTQENGHCGIFQLHPNTLGAQRLGEIWAKSLLEIMEADGIEIKNPMPEWNIFTPGNKKYTIATPRGFLGSKDGVLTNTVRTDIGATTGEFAFIPHEGQYYIYSISDKKFLHRNPVPYTEDWSNIQLSNTHMEPFKVNYTGSKTDYPYTLTTGGYVANVASNTTYGVVLNTWAGDDDGNRISITETGNYDITEAKQILEEYFANQLSVTYRIVDTEGNLLDEVTGIGQTGDIITKVPDNVKRHAYTSYTVKKNVTLKKGKENVVDIIATWNLPFELSPDLSKAHWYNLSLYAGEHYATADNEYKCNKFPTKEDAMTDAYQWAFQGDPYNGIIVYNRAKPTKTLAKVGDRAVLANKVYAWKISETKTGFTLANNEDGKYINEYGGAGGHLGFFTRADAGSTFTVSEVGVMKTINVKFSTGATMKVFPSAEEKANGRAILIIPGGGYSFVSGGYEGADWVPFFNELGYTAAVLTYTVPPTSHDGPLTEARNAMRYLRENTEECHTTTGQVGVIGFSAGGHLASTVATHLKGNDRPAFQILFYPVITMDSTYTHAGSRKNLIGKNPSDKMVKLYSNEKQITRKTPRAYLCWAEDDATVPEKNSTQYVAALKKKKIPVSFKNFPTGGHGFGYRSAYSFHKEMIEDLTRWMIETDGALSSTETSTAVKSKKNIGHNLSEQRVSKP